MKALTWEGKHAIAVKHVHNPRILNPSDAIIKVTTAAICGSDLHLYDGYIPTMQKGDIMGHETMGEVVEIGPNVKKLKVGDRIVIPFDIGCGKCHHCQEEEYAACDNSNPNYVMAEKLYGSSGAGLFGYSHLYGGYAGGQAEYIRVPYADTNSLIIPAGIDDEKVLFLSDIFPTGYMAAENCNIRRGDTVAVWGCGPVGQMAIRSAFMLGAERVIAIDHYEGRLQMAAQSGAEVINYEEEDQLLEELKFRTGGNGPDSCIDAVGLEAHGNTIPAGLDRVKAALWLATDRPNVLRQTLQAARKCGTVSIPGVYGGMLDKVPFGAAFGKGLTLKMGQTHTQKYMPMLLERILKEEIDPSFVITHRIGIDDGPELYKKFNDEKDECIKVVIKM
ncbi:MAG: glutathione-dependent formaldehyde dehydrogenase [Bdellovibrionaceae bacterium]|nr:glutathione-dependent formaldehyde dehydrogenase [Pseudobdellovibrionaceae bacterium]